MVSPGRMVMTVWGNARHDYKCRNSGNVTSSSTSDSGAYGDIGGIVGRNNSNGIIIGAENMGKIEIEKSGGSGAGGIAGNNYGNIENVKNSGRIIGYIYTTNIMGVSEVGGIVGANAEGGSIKMPKIRVLLAVIIQSVVLPAVTGGR